MSIAADIATIAAPALTALGGGYLGARWQARSKADEELRRLTDQALTALHEMRRSAGDAREYFRAEGADTSEEGVDALGRLEEAMREGEELHDQFLIRTVEGDPAPLHLLNALLAIRRARDAIGEAVLWPNEIADDWPDKAETMAEINRSEETFVEDRAAFVSATQRLVGPKRGALARVLGRAKGSGRSST